MRIVVAAVALIASLPPLIIIAQDHEPAAPIEHFIVVMQEERDGSMAMGYYDSRDLPFHWNIADEYVLFATPSVRRLVAASTTTSTSWPAEQATRMIGFPMVAGKTSRLTPYLMCSFLHADCNHTRWTTTS